MNKKWQLGLGIFFLVLALIFKELPFYIISYLVLGYDIFLKAFKNIKNKEFFDENTLMIIATLGAFIISEYKEAVLVILLYQIGETLSSYAVDRSKEKIGDLMDLKDNQVRLFNNQEKLIAADKVKVGDLILVRPGEKVLVDGISLSSSVSLDVKSLTGESLPLVVDKNSEVVSGSIVLDKPLKIKVTKKFSDSTISRIVKFMQEADANKTNTEKFITRFSKVYTPVVCLLALLIFLIPVLLGYDYKLFLYKALIFLVISCPCALVISIPLSFFSAIGRASKEGILVKNTMVLEQARKIKVIYYDKTGTLTAGKFKIEKIVPSKNIDVKLLKELVMAAELYSNHPLSQVFNFSEIKVNKKDIKNLKEIAGKGIKCWYKNKELLVGNFSSEYKEETGSIVEVIYDNKNMGYFVVSDYLKDSSVSVVKEIQKMGIKQIMLTGDQEKFAKKIAASLKIDYKASLLPIDKANIIKKSLNKNYTTVFVGDGINDAPALVSSDIGISMGSIGSDVAMEASDVVLMYDDLKGICKLINLSRYTNLKIKENIIMALGFKIIILILGFLGITSIFMAIFADVGVMLLTLLNSLLIFKKKLDK